MYYKNFRIRNFKGIKDATINLSDQTRMGVFAFVGLNESGKTTILEAIHSFRSDRPTSELVGGETKSGVPFEERVPRHLISNFSDNVSVTATLAFEENEKQEFAKDFYSTSNLEIDLKSLPDELSITNFQKFTNGDLDGSFFRLDFEISLKTRRQKKWRKPDIEQRRAIRESILKRAPIIAYFPTFVFDFPDQIFLTEERGDSVSWFYRRVFQDILDFDGQGHTIEKSIIQRIRAEDKKVPWPTFLEIYSAGTDKDKIQHVLDCAGSAVTDVVFGRWNEIFGEDVKGKEIVIVPDTIEGERKQPDGARIKTNEHDFFIRFQVKDGNRRFNVNDRSLGFRWFFAFMLFTQFRVARENAPPIMFLFDEPASNLHASAQEKLIESFPEIARDGHTLAYTTHSHHMIEPKWLEQTFIVTNRDDQPTEDILDAVSASDESLDIQASRYRTFVNSFPSRTSYFQPILDRLDVKPSRFDIERPSLVIEGKSDYYILRYAAAMLELAEPPLLPGMGSGTYDALVALNIGWGLQMLFVLDGDRAGKKERDRYNRELGLPVDHMVTLDEIDPQLKEIEDLLDETAKARIQSSLGLSRKPTKKQIARYFQESLAQNRTPRLGRAFTVSSKKVITRLQDRLRESYSS